ncbi:hypothetical protein [Catenovulum sediminis]|uniref:Uncharacterized protein n=1 Tax=Catenovulum sediminis TaxID=1740262 RepID=A0ABV1RKG0_9ALTE
MNIALYGLVDATHAESVAVAVCNVLGYGSNNNAHVLILETAAQETQLGHYLDHTWRSAGMGLTQVDFSTFNWLQNEKFERYQAKVKHAFGVDLMQVQWEELDQSPLLAFIVCRIRYLVVPNPIPTSVNWRARYWKQHYNTQAGKGKPDEYIENAKRYAHYIPQSEQLCTG